MKVDAGYGIIDGQRAASRSISSRITELAIHNLELCDDCPQYRDDVVSGQPESRPCGVNRKLTVCAWRSAAGRGENQGGVCAWVASVGVADEVVK